MTSEGGWWGTRRPLATPRPVWVDLPLALPPSRVSSGRDVPLRVRAAGIDNSASVPGELLAWRQTQTGDWWALTSFEVICRSGKARLALTQLLPANAVRPQ